MKVKNLCTDEMRVRDLIASREHIAAVRCEPESDPALSMAMAMKSRGLPPAAAAVKVSA